MKKENQCIRPVLLCMKLPAISHHFHRRGWHHPESCPPYFYTIKPPGINRYLDRKLLQKHLYTEAVLLPAVGWWGSCLDTKEGSGDAKYSFETLEVNEKARIITTSQACCSRAEHNNWVIRTNLGCGVSVQTASPGFAAGAVIGVNNRVNKLWCFCHFMTFCEIPWLWALASSCT